MYRNVSIYLCIVRSGPLITMQPESFLFFLSFLDFFFFLFLSLFPIHGFANRCVFSGLGAAAEQLNQTELAVLLNLLQGQTDLKLPQVAQLLSLSDSDTVSQLLSTLNEASDHQGAAEDHAQPPAVSQPPEPPPEPQEASPTSGEPPLSQEDQASLLALILGQIIKPQTEAQSDESNGVKSEEALTRSSSASTTDSKGKSGFNL